MNEGSSKKLENLNKEEERYKEKLKEIKAERAKEKKRIRISKQKRDQAEAFELIKIAKDEKMPFDNLREDETIYEYLVSVKKKRDEEAKKQREEEVKKQLDKVEDADKHDGENTEGFNENSAGAKERSGEA